MGSGHHRPGVRSPRCYCGSRRGVVSHYCHVQATYSWHVPLVRYDLFFLHERSSLISENHCISGMCFFVKIDSFHLFYQPDCACVIRNALNNVQAICPLSCHHMAYSNSWISQLKLLEMLQMFRFNLPSNIYRRNCSGRELEVIKRLWNISL